MKLTENIILEVGYSIIVIALTIMMMVMIFR